MDKFIYSFNAGEITLDKAGGKGLNLSKTALGGFPVPTGFIITTDAYRLFIQTNQIDAGIASLYQALSIDDPASVEMTSQAIRQLFTSGQLPEDIQSSILTAYHKLCTQTGNSPVAVRSSATAEDLPGASFAGQQDTYLNIHGDAALLEGVKHCWSSLWSERAMVYRAHQGIPPEAVSLAVVVQQMVPAESAGVMFMANPVSGARDEIVINAAWGLGEAIVSGLVVPDQIVVDKETRKRNSLIIADKTIMTVRTESGTKEQPVPVNRRKMPTLSDSRAAELAELGLRIEQYYGSPQDIEWCFAKGRFYIVQVRPITALPEPPLSWKAPGEGQWLHGGGTFEMITEPFSPLFETVLLPIFSGALIQMLEDIGLSGVLPTIPYCVVNGHIYLHVDLHLRPWNLAGVVRDFALHMNSMKNQDAEQTLYRQTVADLAQPPGVGLTPEQLLERLNGLGRAGMRYWIQIMKIVQVIYRQEKAFTDFYNHHLRRPNIPEPEIFLRGQKIKSWEAECGMFDLAQVAKKLGLAEKLMGAPEQFYAGLESDSAVSAWRSALERHLNRFGHQLASFDLALPTLADDPRPVLTAIQAYLSGKESPYQRQQRMEEERQAAIVSAKGCLSTRNISRFHQLLSTAQQAARTREDAIFEVGLAWTHMHRTALELGTRLAQKGIIAQPRDVFWLHQDEIRSSFAEPSLSNGFIQKMAERKTQNESWSGVDAPYLLPLGSRPAFWWKWIFPVPELNRHPDAHTLVGLGVSPGKVTAVARVVRSLDEAQRINPGEILVTRTTTPAWTPLFAHIAGLVTDLGGPLAHGSIVAREYGIPAVMGTGSATLHIKDGEVITVDGTAGRVALN